MNDKFMSFDQFLSIVKKLGSIRQMSTNEGYELMYIEMNEELEFQSVFPKNFGTLSKSVGINGDFSGVFGDIVSELSLMSLTSFQNQSTYKDRISKFLDMNEDFNLNIRKMTSKIYQAGNIIATDGRIGAANYVITNSNNYQFIKATLENSPQISLIVHDGVLENHEVIVGRVNEPDQPGLMFIYTVVDDRIFYEIVGIGFYPEKQCVCVKF